MVKRLLRFLLKLSVGLLLITSLVTCSSISFRDFGEKQTSQSISDGHSTEIGSRIQGALNQHPDKTGLLLLDKGEDALVWRGSLVDLAEKSIDIQTFIWDPDNVGTIAAERVLRAAHRGVRVRVLIDDFTLSGDPQHLIWLNGHPNVAIRIYNPLSTPATSMLKKVMAMFDNWSINNRRMHNKLFVVDNSVAITGGRNISDSYYDMSDHFNYRDRDVLVAGQVVSKLSGSFDQYWNSAWAVPLEFIVEDETEAQAREAYYQELSNYAKDPAHYPQRFDVSLAEKRSWIDRFDTLLTWAEVEMFVDQPGKNESLEEMAGFGITGRVLTETAAATKREILAETPYLIPMGGTMALFEQLQARGIEVSILTNSMNSTDNYPAFSGYVKKRPGLLKAGVHLYEMRSDPDAMNQLVDRHELIEGEMKMGLHAKTAVFDRKTVFIGSFNLDPRSTHLNTELGLLIHSEAFADQVAESILADMSQGNSWQVISTGSDSMMWRTKREGVLIETEREPEVGISTSIKMFFFFLMPYEEIL